VYVAALLASIPVFTRLGLYRAVIRYLGPKAVLAVVSGVTFSVVLLSCIALLWPQRSVPVTALPIYWAFALIYVGGSRFMIRGLLNFRWSSGTQRVVIYGAGGTINGLEVFPPRALPDLVNNEGVAAVLLALPSQSRRRRQEILKSIEPLSLLVQTVPDYGDILSGNARVEDVRDVDAGDLLGRDPVPPNARLLDACINNKVVPARAGPSARSCVVRSFACIRRSCCCSKCPSSLCTTSSVS
jgi:FlaA1/EpsC-like NDP-sugar epimerase